MLEKRYGLAIQSDVNSKTVIVLMVKVKKFGFRNRKFYQLVIVNYVYLAFYDTLHDSLRG